MLIYSNNVGCFFFFIFFLMISVVSVIMLITAVLSFLFMRNDKYIGSQHNYLKLLFIYLLTYLPWFFIFIF